MRNFLRCELDSTFQELDTPPSRCCWRCGCAMSCVSLITSDIDQAFEACSASAVLPAWRDISRSYESRLSSNSVLVRWGRRELCSVPGPYQSVQRAELWGVILALQSSGAVHLGVDNLGVVRHVGRLLDGRPGSIPFELLKDGDLLLLIDRMLRRGRPPCRGGGA